jgi:hypothetical protein
VKDVFLYTLCDDMLITQNNRSDVDDESFSFVFETAIVILLSVDS